MSAPAAFANHRSASVVDIDLSEEYLLASQLYNQLPSSPRLLFHTSANETATMPPASNTILDVPNNGIVDSFLSFNWVHRQYQILDLNSPNIASISSVHRSRTHAHLPHVRRAVAAATVEAIPTPPPPYTPTMTLHAATLTPTTTYPSITPNEPTAQPPPTYHINVGLLIGAIVICIVLGTIIAILVTLMVKRRRVRMGLPGSSQHLVSSSNGIKMKKLKLLSRWSTCEEDEDEAVSRSSMPYNRTSSILEYFHLKRDGREDEFHLVNSESGYSQGHPADETPVRRYSSPATLYDHHPLSPEQTPARPSSLPPPERDVSIYIQRQKEAEIAQIMRMKVILNEPPVPGASSFPNLDRPQKQRTVMQGLGIVHDEQELDISSTVLSALHHYSFAFDQSSPSIPISDVFQVSKEGRVVRSPPTSFSEPMSLASSSSDMSLDELEEEDVVEVRMAHTRSMEMTKPVLVSLGGGSTADVPELFIQTPSTISSNRLSTSSLSYISLNPFQPFLRPESPSSLSSTTSTLSNTISNFPSPPPMLSPILPSSSLTFSAEIEASLEERVFAYRDSGPWSKQQYKLTTPGQVRALAEAVALRKPTMYHRETAWPWPAQRPEMGAV